jgi:hypothetical protein
MSNHNPKDSVPLVSSSAAIGTLDELVDDCSQLSARVARQLSTPAALLLPAPARESIRELAHLLTRIAVEVKQCPCRQSNPSR